MENPFNRVYSALKNLTGKVPSYGNETMTVSDLLESESLFPPAHAKRRATQEI